MPDGTPLFPDLGTHCAHPACRQLDFLPHRCTHCNLHYCLEHRTADAHKCPAKPASGTENTVLVCPMCAQAVALLSPDEDPNVAWERHRTTPGACDEANYAKVHRKPVCGAPGCRARLNLSNQVKCKHCGVATCLTHRFPAEHSCRRAPSSGATKSAVPLLSAFTARPAAPRAPPVPRPPAPGGAGPELCPQCGARFADVVRLVQHVQEVHERPPHAPLRAPAAASCRVS